MQQGNSSKKEQQPAKGGDVAMNGEKSKEEKKKQIEYVKLSRVFGLKKQVPYFIGGMFGALCNGAMLPGFSIVFGKLFNILGDKDMTEVRNIALAFLGLAIGSFIFAYMQVYFFTVIGETLTKEIRYLLFKALSDQEVGFFDTNETGVLTTRLSSDTVTVQNGISEKVGQVVYFGSQTIVSIIIALVHGWKMTLVMIALSPLIIAGGAIQTSFIMSGTKKSSEAYEEAGQKAEEVISGIRTVTSFTQEKNEISQYSSMVDKVLEAGKKKAHWMGFGFGISFFTIFAVYALGFWYGGKLVKEGDMNGGDVLTVFFAIVFAGFGLGQAAQLSPDFAKARAAATSIFEIIDRKPLVDPNVNGVKITRLQGNIELKNVKFTYPARPDIQVMNGLDLNVEKGQKIALVGPSGSGKSTVISLVERFYDVDSGSVLIDGVDIREYNLFSLRDHIGLVQQEPILFGGSIYENIKYGNENATMEDVIEAAKQAHAHDFIQELPRKYETEVGERGAQLSGGQKQRIAIARAILKNPSILLLDEATSALDAESEKLVKDALEILMKGRTSLIIAHRLSTIKDADKIAVIKAGRVVEEGKHDELMELDGSYKELVRRQVQGISIDAEVEGEEEKGNGSKS